jgi:hypothetical protein
MNKKGQIDLEKAIKLRMKLVLTRDICLGCVLLLVFNWLVLGGGYEVLVGIFIIVFLCIVWFTDIYK